MQYSPKITPLLEALPRGKQLDIADLTTKGMHIRDAIAEVQKQREAGDDTEAEEAAGKDELLDAAGEPVPARATVAFEKAKQIAAVCREIAGMARRIDAISQDVATVSSESGGRLIGTGVVRTLRHAKETLETVKGHLWAERATHVCPYCHGKQDQCDCCKGEGWTAKHVWEQAPGNNKKDKR
jgi:hypothetical protein